MNKLMYSYARDEISVEIRFSLNDKNSNEIIRVEQFLYIGDLIVHTLNNDFKKIFPSYEQLLEEYQGDLQEIRDNEELNNLFCKACDKEELSEYLTYYKDKYSYENAEDKYIQLENCLKEEWDKVDINFFAELINTVFLSITSETMNVKKRFYAFYLANMNKYIDKFSITTSTFFCPQMGKSDFIDLVKLRRDVRKSSNLDKNNIQSYILEHIEHNPRQCTLESAQTVQGFERLIVLDIIEMFQSNIIVKKCANCGKYFVPRKRNDAIYCDNISPQDESKTCKEYGARQAWKTTLKEKETAGLYRNIYMSKQMLAKRNPDIEEYTASFEKFKTESKKWKSDVKSGVKSESDYLEWLKEVKEKKVL